MSSHKITAHHLNASRSQRLFWLLEELGMPYDVQVHFRLPTRQAPPSLTSIAPFGKAPVIVLDGETISESGNIVNRLLAIAPDAVSTNVEVKPSNDSVFWSHFSEGSMMNLFQMGAAIAATSAAFVGGQMGGLEDAEKSGVKKYAEFLNEKYLRNENQKNLNQIEDYLSNHSGQYFSGTDKPGAGDFMMFFPIHSLILGGRKDAGYNVGPATRKYFDMVMARPAVKKGLERLSKEEESAKAKI